MRYIAFLFIWIASCNLAVNAQEEELPADSNVALDLFLQNHKDDFISFDVLPQAGSKSFKDKLLSLAYYTLRRIKG